MVDFNYDSEVDILTVDLEDRKPDEYEESLPLGNYIVDLDGEEEFLGLEILNASRNLPFNKQELKSIENVELELNKTEESTTIAVNIEYSGNKGKFSFGYGTVQAQLSYLQTKEILKPKKANIMSRDIVTKEGILGGEPFLEGTRIRVSDITTKYEELGYSVNEIVQAYQRLEIEDVEEVLL